jgi:glycosyltransferase involved in cell wall biosynthesis
LGFFLWLFVEKLIVCSSYVKSKFSLLSKKIKIIYLGVDDVYFENERDVDNEFKEGVSIFYPAAFRKGKKQELLINNLARLSKRYNDITLFLPGDGENLNRCKALADTLNVSDKVVFPGFLYKHELIALLRNCNLAVIPSVSETFGHCIAEPFVAGKCVVSRSVGVANDVIANGANGYVFGNDEELYDILDKLLVNRELLTVLGSKAFKDRSIFKWDVIATEYEKFVIG